MTDGSRIVWQDPVGEGVRVEASGVHADVSWHNGATVLHANSENVLAVVAAGTLGPWRVDVDRTPDSSRTCVGLDPAIAGACTLLVVGDAETTTAVDVTLPRTPIDSPRGPGHDAGTVGQGDLQAEATAHYADQRERARRRLRSRARSTASTLSGVPLPVGRHLGGGPRRAGPTRSST